MDDGSRERQRMTAGLDLATVGVQQAIAPVLPLAEAVSLPGESERGVESSGKRYRQPEVE